jgi:Bacteriophage related domain of unknown function
MSLEKIHQGLISQFKIGFAATWTGRLAWENVVFTPPENAPWMSFHFMPVSERISTLGELGYDEAEGMAQVDVFYPAGVGEKGVRQTINELRACFAPGLLAYEGQPFSILSRSRGTGGLRDGFYHIPFTVRWRAKLSRA